MKIVISVNDDGYIICKTIKNDYLHRYVSFKNYNDIIDDILSSCKRISISSKDLGIIKFNNGVNEVVIENYKKNRDMYVDRIIEKAISIYKKSKQERLRKQKIKRIKTFAGVMVISLGIVGSAFAISNSSDAIVNDDEFFSNNNIETVVLDTNYDFENSNMDIVYTTNNYEDNLITEDIDNIKKESFNLEYSDRTSTDKFINTKANYYSLISKISSEYGIDPQIMLAIATQESGVHNINHNGPAIGLMQIERSVWVGNSVTAFNHNKNSLETLQITQEKLEDLEFNIRVACMIFQNCLENSNYNLEVAIQMYNYGIGNVLNTFKMYYNKDDITLREALNNYSDEWLDFRQYINVGDKDYLEHVMSYMENADDINCLDRNNNIKSYEFNKLTKTL